MKKVFKKHTTQDSVNINKNGNTLISHLKAIEKVVAFNKGENSPFYNPSTGQNRKSMHDSIDTPDNKTTNLKDLPVLERTATISAPAFIVEERTIGNILSITYFSDASSDNSEIS